MAIFRRILEIARKTACYPHMSVYVCGARKLCQITTVSDRDALDCALV
jgi:hypothetical protein